MPETLADLLRLDLNQNRDVHSIQTLFFDGDLLVAFTAQGGQVYFYYVVGNHLVPAQVEKNLLPLLDALRVQWSEPFMPDGRQCPKCAAELPEERGEPPGFFPLRGGMTANTPDGPGERWVEGIFTCLVCGHQWEGGLT